MSTPAEQTPPAGVNIAPTICAIIDERHELARKMLEPCRVIAEIDTLSNLMIEAKGPYAPHLQRDVNGAWTFQDLPLTVVARADVPPRGWTILTRR